MKREGIKVEKRTVVGKKVKKIRKEGILPANIYGKDFKSLACQLPLKEFKNIYKKVHETGLVDLTLDSQILPVLIHNVQIDPTSQEVLHADFYKVDLKEKIKANIPVIAVDESPAVIDKKGLLLQIMSELEIEALPTDLPEKIEVSTANLKEVGEEILVSSIKAPNGVTILSDLSQIVFKIGELVSREAEEQAKAEEAAAAEAATEAAPADQTPAATEAAPAASTGESKEKQPAK